MGRRWIFYLAVNVIVSAATMLVVLSLWGRPNAACSSAEANGIATLAPGTPTAPTEQPSPTQVIYIIRSGDTLGEIAEKYGVDADELAAYNGITDVYSLEVGFKLIIPPSARNEPESPNPTVTPAENEAFPWPTIEEASGTGDLIAETIQIKNPGPGADLTGWKIRTPGGVEYVFPSFFLVAQGAVDLHTGAGDDTSIDLYWGQSQSIWAPGDTVLLFDALGNLRSVYTIP